MSDIEIKIPAKLIIDGIEQQTETKVTYVQNTGHYIYNITGLNPETTYNICVEYVTKTEPSPTPTNWVTKSKILQYNKDNQNYNIRLTGFNISNSQYYAQFPYKPNDDCTTQAYFNYYNNYIYSNLVNVAKIIYDGGGNNYNNLNNLSSGEGVFNNIPSIRIPLNADYWLNGSGSSSSINQAGQTMSSDQYQNMIKAMVYYLMNPLGSVSGREEDVPYANGCVIIFDLHWNYSTGDAQSASLDSDQSLPTEQCAMAVADNSIKFWDSMCDIFGITKDGNELQETTCKINTNNSEQNDGIIYTLTKEMKKNVFFELYNEPYLDQISYNGEKYSDYENQFKLYIQGSKVALGGKISDQNNGKDFNIVGMGTLYKYVRESKKCYNIIVLSEAENYGCFDGSNYMELGNETKPNNFKSTYNCWNKLKDAIISGSTNNIKIPILDLDGNYNGKNYEDNANGLEYVIANIHPYSNNRQKFPGYVYVTSETSKDENPNNADNGPCLSNFLEAMIYGTNPKYDSYSDAPYKPSDTIHCPDFKINFPIVFSEFGMFYNLTWINEAGKTYTDFYSENPDDTSPSRGTEKDWSGDSTNSSSTNTPYFGQYFDKYGTPTYAPLVIGYYEALKDFNVSLIGWTLLPQDVDFNWYETEQLNYNPTTTNDGNIPTMRLLQNDDLNNKITGQRMYDVQFCFDKYYLSKDSKENFYLITVSTKPDKVLDILVKNIQSKGETIEILGKKSFPYEIGQDFHGGRKMKIKLDEVYNFINRPSLNPNDIVLFTDAYDVYYSGDKKTVLERFKKMNKPIVFGAEKCCYPDASKSKLYPHIQSAFRYLNSGLFIGRIEALRECMKNIEYETIEDNCDDQLWWTNKFLERQDLIKLDYNNELFLNCVWCDKNDLILNGDKVTLRYNNSTPQFIHGNGPSKDIIQPLLDYFNNK